MPKKDDWDDFPEDEKKLAEQIDFPTIVMNQINEVRIARKENDPGKFISAVEGLDDLVNQDYDKKFRQDLEEINERYKPVMKKMRNPVDNRVKRLVAMRKSRDVFRALMRLLNRKGYLPEKKVYEVI